MIAETGTDYRVGCAVKAFSVHSLLVAQDCRSAYVAQLYPREKIFYDSSIIFGPLSVPINEPSPCKSTWNGRLRDVDAYAIVTSRLKFYSKAGAGDVNSHLNFSRCAV